MNLNTFDILTVNQESRQLINDCCLKFQILVVIIIIKISFSTLQAPIRWFGFFRTHLYAEKRELWQIRIVLISGISIRA